MSFSDSISPRAEQLITSMLSVLPISLHLSLVKVLETHLFESGATQYVKEETYVKDAVRILMEGKKELPIKILVKDIVGVTTLVFSGAYLEQAIEQSLSTLRQRN